MAADHGRLMWQNSDVRGVTTVVETAVPPMKFGSTCGQAVEVARVGRRAADAHARLEARAARQPGFEADIDTVVDLPLLAVMRVLRDDVVHAAKGGGLDVVEPADLIPAATGQSLVGSAP